MSKSKVNPYALFRPYEPVRCPVLMFKVNPLERLRQMQNGLIYMNSLQYFSEIEDEGNKYLRGDPLEKIYERLCAGDNSRLELTIKSKNGEKTFDLGDDAVLTVEFPKPKNVMIFCMSSFIQDDTGKIRGESNGQIKISERLLEFGDHILLIRNAPSFFNRISNAINT